MKYLIARYALCGILSVLILSCSMNIDKTFSMKYEFIKNRIEIPYPQKSEMRKFSANEKSQRTTIKKDTDIILSGYTTNNKEFLEKIITPAIFPHKNSLAKMHPVEMINTLSVFCFFIYKQYLGLEIFRWGGDILDLDDPQDEGIRYDKAYGLDCSGFCTIAYELAVYYGFLNPQDDAALFSSKGFEIYCKKNSIKDKGGRGGTSNNWRVDTNELAELGREIMTVDRGSEATDEQFSKIQPGDIIGRSGHFGIAVNINGQLYYLESGGWVVPPNGWNPIKMREAIKIFAQNGKVSARRCLPDYHTNIAK